MRFFHTKQFYLSLTLLFISSMVSAADHRDNVQGLISVAELGDPAPVGRYFHIVAGVVVDSLQAFVDVDSVPRDCLLGVSFAPDEDPIFRFDKDPYDSYYKIMVGREPLACVDVRYDDFSHLYGLEIGQVGYGAGQSFYLRHVGNGRYQIVHSSGKILGVNIYRLYLDSPVVLSDDVAAPLSEWVLVDPLTGTVYKPSES